MTLSRPSAVLTVDGQSLTAAEAGLARLELRLSIGGSHDAASLWLWPGSRFADTALGAVLEIALGEAGDEIDVWAGEVTERRRRPEALWIEGLCHTAALNRVRTSSAWEGQSVADIVRELAGDAAIDEVEADTQLEAYAVDDRRTVWAHLCELAARTGAEIGASASGGLRFVTPQTGSAGRTLRWGADLLDWTIGASPTPSPPKVVAHGAASEAGADRWHWPRLDPADGVDGPVRVAPFHTREAADALTEALAARAERRAIEGELCTTGRPDLRPGDIVDLDDVPDVGAVRLLEVAHVLDARRGFISELRVEGGGGGGPL